MKDTDITITFNSEKLDALTFYIGKKETDVQSELDETMMNLYLKHVPAPTREYIEDKLEREGNSSPEASKPAKKPVPPVKKKKKKEDTSRPVPEEKDLSAADDTTEQSTQEKVDDLVGATVDEEEGNHENGDYPDAKEDQTDSADGFLDGLLN